VRPDLILLDIMMPELDGFEVCRALKSDPSTRDAIVVFLSALGEVTDKVTGLELGA
jgi:DNA-binding response OmpR family regulator